jgi:acetyl-CoA C-acetyltransferase
MPRQPPSFGHVTAQDSLVVDGLFDVYNKFAMGNCGEHTAKKYEISRESQDDHAIESYRRVERAYAEGKFDAELCPVTIKGKKGDTVVKEDEEYKKVFYEKIRTLRPVFAKEGGSITAANASKLNDGASAVVLMTEEKMKALGVKPLARILGKFGISPPKEHALIHFTGFADAAAAPIDFPTAPTLAIPKALKAAGVSQEDVALFELNEAFSVVVRAAEKIMDIDPAKINALGGAVALGHPIGSSGCRIVVTLAHQLKEGEIGVAGVCNGGGAASAMVIQRC